jgi:hypothetical protein
MKHIQNFNKFNEEVGMGMFPVDVVKSAPDAYKDIFAGVSDLYNDVVDEMGSKIKELKDAFKGVSEQEVEKIAQFMKKTFGTVTPEMTKENGIKLAKALGLDTISENFKADENIVVKIIGRIKQVLGINVASTGGFGLSIILTYVLKVLGVISLASVGVATTLGLAVAGIAVAFMFSKIMEMFGYDDDSMADIGNYNPKMDIRNKF